MPSTANEFSAPPACAKCRLPIDYPPSWVEGKPYHTRCAPAVSPSEAMRDALRKAKDALFHWRMEILVAEGMPGRPLLDAIDAVNAALATPTEAAASALGASADAGRAVGPSDPSPCGSRPSASIPSASN